MLALCSRLGLKGSFFSTPTAIFASFSDGQRPDTYLMRAGVVGIDLGKLAELDAISARVARGEMSPEHGLMGISAIENVPPRYGPLLTTLCYCLNSGAAARFLGGGLMEMAVGALLGLVVGILGSFGHWRAFEPVAAFAVALVGTMVVKLIGPMALHVSILAGLIALVPGYTLTVSLAELSNGHLASGSARLTSAFMNFLALAFGVALGTRIGTLLVGGTESTEPGVLPAWTVIPAIVLAAITFAVLFRAHRRDLPWIMLVSIIGFTGARAGSYVLGPELGAFVGALGATLMSNLYTRAMDRPSVVALFPSIMLLVPGSIGFRSLSSLLANDVVSGVQTAFTMILVAVALVAGLLLANELFPPRRVL